jgi:CheY-like chemotaxis protein
VRGRDGLSSSRQEAVLSRPAGLKDDDRNGGRTGDRGVDVLNEVVHLCQQVVLSMHQYIQLNKPWFDTAHAVSSVLSLVGWSIGLPLLVTAWVRGRVRALHVGPIGVQFKEEAMIAVAAADRSWRARVKSKPSNVPLMRKTIEEAFTPEVADNLVGRSVLWVDDRPYNNELVVRALKKLQLDVEQVESTEIGMARLADRSFDLVISDMERHGNRRAGYELLAQIRALDQGLPFFIFASEDKPEFRKEAAERGAQLSTNDVVELMSEIVDRLGKQR